MSSKSHMQELQLEKEKVNEVRVNECFDKKATQTASKEDHYGLEKRSAIESC